MIKQMGNKSILLFVALFLIVFMVGCGAKTETSSSTTPATTNQPKQEPSNTSTAVEQIEKVKIGVILPVTGALARTGTWVLDGHKMGIKEINESGGFKVGDKTYQLEMIHYDSEGRAESATAATERLLNQDKVVTILGTSVSSETAAMIPIAERAKTPLTTMVAASDILTAQGAQYFTQAAPANINYVDAGVKTMKDFGMQNIAFITIDDAWGQSYGKLYPPKIEAAGIKIVSRESFAPDQTDFVTLLNKVKAANPDGILLAAETEKAIPLLKQLHEVLPGIKRLEAGGTIPEEVLRLDPQIAEGLVTLSRAGEETAEIKDFKDRFQKDFGYDANSFTYSGRDGMFLLVDAFQKAGGVTDKDKIKDAIRGANFKGLIGTYSFNEKGENRLTGNRAVIKNGQVIYQRVDQPLP